MGIVTYFIFLGSNITPDKDYRHEIQRCLLLGKKDITNIESILTSRDITLPTKVRIVKAMAFLVVMYGCESWTIKKAGHQRFDTFELWCWRRLLRVLDLEIALDCKAMLSGKSMLKEINPEYSLEGLMLKLSFSALTN